MSNQPAPTHFTKQVLQQMNRNDYKYPSVSNEKSRTLDNISDILIVRKITEQDPSNLKSQKGLDEENSLDVASEFNREEQNLLAEEHEVIVRKQIQMLQADERGKQALISEIAAIKQRQQKRAEVLKNRQLALDIEKERAKRIASLPPPLPKSVKSLLRKQDESKSTKPNVQMPDELQAVSIKGVVFGSDENKENILDPEEQEEKERMQEEWQLKANKRFNEALKKDRQKEEYANIMKQLQTAELQSRREMAKSISSDKIKTVPCPVSDKFHSAQKQTDMEDAAEKLFKKNKTKEHVIEDIEGYQDYYETKYKKMESEYEAKMIDCVPSFVKENYEYLLEDESKFQGGKNFSGLDDSGSDILNQAYIETPPQVDPHEGGGKIDQVINQLDKLRSELQTQYDQTLKPLLVAAMESPKKELRDKAVETELQPAEDKAVGTDALGGPQFTPPSSSDLKIPKSISYKRKFQGPYLYQGFSVPDMHHRDVHYPVPSVPDKEGLATGSWSSSSYCSLPSKHGFPNFPSSSESAKCDICVAEMENALVKQDLPQELPRSTSAYAKERKGDIPMETDAGKVSPKEKTPLSDYVQQLAKKYLEAKSSTLSEPCKEDVLKSFNESLLSTHSEVKTISPAFEKEIVSKLDVDSVASDKKSSKLTPVSEEKKANVHSSVSYSEEVVSLPRQYEKENGQDLRDSLWSDRKVFSDLLTKQKNDINIMKDADYYRSPTEYPEHDSEALRLQMIKKVLSRRIPRFAFNLSPKPITTDEAEAGNLPTSSTDANIKQVFQPHVFHELSTIQEMDSALTAGSSQLSQSGFSLEKSVETVEKEILKEKPEESVENSSENLKIASLLDPPDSKIAELAKSIHFVAETKEKVVKPPNVTQTPSSDGMSISSKDSLSTPSHIFSSDSSSTSTSLSATKVFSSTLAGNNVKYPHLKDTETLPQYFKDVSDIKQKSSGTENSVSKSETSSVSRPSCSSIVSSSSQSIPSVVDANMKEGQSRKFKSSSHPLISGYISNIRNVDSSSSGTFHPMIPYTNISSPDIGVGEKKIIVSSEKAEFTTEQYLESGYIRDLSSPGTFRPMTPHYDISGPDSQIMQVDENKKRDIRTSHLSSPGTFRPMTPHYDISGPDSQIMQINENKRDLRTSNMSSPGTFRPMTPHYDISGPDSEIMQIDENKKVLRTSHLSSPGTFRPMTPHYDISGPDSQIMQVDENKKRDLRSHSSSPGTFRPMTPHYDISGPDSEIMQDHENKKVLRTSHLSSPGTFRPMTPHYDISGPDSQIMQVDENKKRDLRTSHLSSPDTFHPMTPHYDISSPEIHVGEKNRNSSSEKGEFTTNQYLESGYIRDLSSPGTSCPMTSHYDISVPDSRIMSVDGENKIHLSEEGKYSYNDPLVSGYIRDLSSPSTFRSMTSHSHTHLPDSKEIDKNEKIKVSEEVDCSSNEPLVSGYISDLRLSHLNSPGTFHSRTPHSNLSSLGKSRTSKFMSDVGKNKEILSSKEFIKSGQDSTSSSSSHFKSMTPHSNISSGTMTELQYQDHTSSVGSSKAFTSKSISPPSPPYNEEYQGQNISSRSPKFHPMKFRLDFSSPQTSSSDDINSQNSVKKLPKFNCHINLKAQMLESPQPMRVSKVVDKNLIPTTSRCSNTEKHDDLNFPKQPQRENYAQGKTRAKQPAGVCSSDFFVPQLGVADLPSPQTKNDEWELEEGTLNEINVDIKSNPDSKQAAFHSVTSGSSSVENRKISHAVEQSSSNTTGSYDKSYKGSSQQQQLGHVSTGSSKNQVFPDTELFRSLKKQYPNLQAISSNSSSSENLSDMFSGSKITYQSTPIKSLEEIIQETGIMEEPDLTLITTEYTCKPDSPEMARASTQVESTNLPIDNSNTDKDCTLRSSVSECKTPTATSPQLKGSVDTPSMISFLHHEMSCIQDDDTACILTPLQDKDQNVASEASGVKEQSQNEVQKDQKFPRVGYKQRTKRLWNNLEEVKKKNSAEEHRRFMTANRLKAKEFAKKLTPRKNSK